MATIKLNNVSIATETAGAAALTVPSIQQTDAQNISGTKASHEMFMGKTFTLTGDLTVNDNLVFANLTGGGADITITDDGNGRTITTGSAGTLEGGEFLGTVPPPTDISTMTSGAIASAITGSPAIALTNATGTLGSGVSVPPTLLEPSMRQIQHQYKYIASDAGQTISTSNATTMTGAPQTVQTPVFNTLNISNTAWRIEGYSAVNNESSATNWNCSMTFWVSYDAGSTWVTATPGAANAGDYMAYTDHGDEYTYINSVVYNTGITANQPNTIFGVAFYSYESDNTRWNMIDGMGYWISCTQYQT